MEDSLEKYGTGIITWKKLCLSEKIPEIEEFLWKADIGLELCGKSMTDYIYELKSTLSSCLRKFLRNPGIQCRCIQLLQDCHVLCPIGIVHKENDEIFDVVCATLNYYLKSSADVITYVFELLAMLFDENYVKSKDTVICELKKTGEKSVLSQVITAINTHANIKAVQRGGMLLIDAIFHFMAVENHSSTIYKVFHCVLETLLRNIDDPSICFSSFSILSQVAAQESNLMTSWLDQIIFLAVRTISKQFSAEVVSKCVYLLNSLAKDDTMLLKVSVALHQLTSVQAPGVAVKPGFVIRTKRLLPPQWKKDKRIEKVYINVFHHESIDMVYKNDESHLELDDEIDEDKRGDFSELVVVTCGEAAFTEGADGSQCVLYNLAVSSEFFAKSASIDEQSQSIFSSNAVRQLIRELNIKFGDYLDETNFSLPRISSNYKGGRIPHLLLRVDSPNNAVSSIISTTSAEVRDVTMCGKGEEAPGGLLVLCTAIGLMGSSSTATKQHLESIIMSLELTFRILVDEHCCAVVFQDVNQQAINPSNNGPSIFQEIVSSLSQRILRLSEEASDDLDITKMDYLNLLFNSIVENLEYLETSESDFSQILASYSVVSVASSPVCKRTSSHSVYRSFRQSQRLPILTYSAALNSDGNHEIFTNAVVADDDFDDDLDQNERELSTQRLQWGPLLITTGPQLCDKVSFLNSLQEDVHCISIDETPGLYEPVYIAVALELWKKEAAMDKGKLAELNNVVSFLKRREVCGMSVFDRLMRLRLKEVMFLTLLFHRMISPEEFEEAMAKLIPDEATRTILLDSVAEIFMSFEDEAEREENQGRTCEAQMMTSNTLDIFIPEAALQATASAAQEMKAAIKNTKSLVCWANTNIIPDFYSHVLGYAERYNRIVRFVRWGSEIPRISAHELMKRNILRFLSTGRYIEATKLMVFHQTAETLFYDNNSPISSMDTRVTVTHPELAFRAGYFMDLNGQVTSVSHPNIKQIMKAAEESVNGDPRKNSSRWNSWKNNGQVFPITLVKPTSPVQSNSPIRGQKKSKGFKVTFSFPLSATEAALENEEINKKDENMTEEAINTITKHAANIGRDDVFEEEEAISVCEDGITFVLADSGGSLVRHTEIPLSCASSSTESAPAIDVFYYIPAELPNDGPESAFSQMMMNPLSLKSFPGETEATEMKVSCDEQSLEEEISRLDEIQELEIEQLSVAAVKEDINESDAEKWQEEENEPIPDDDCAPIPDDDSVRSAKQKDSTYLSASVDGRKAEETSLMKINAAPMAAVAYVSAQSNCITFCREKISSNRGGSKVLQKQVSSAPNSCQGGDFIRQRIKALGLSNANGERVAGLPPSSAGHKTKSAISSPLKVSPIRKEHISSVGSSSVSANIKENKRCNSPVNCRSTTKEIRQSNSPAKDAQRCNSPNNGNLNFSNPKQNTRSNSPINSSFHFIAAMSAKAKLVIEHQQYNYPRIRNGREEYEVEVEEREVEPYQSKACCSYSLVIAGVFEAVGIGAETILTSPFARICSCSKKAEDTPPPAHSIDVISAEGLTLLQTLGQKIYATYVLILEDSKTSGKGYSYSPLGSPVSNNASFFPSNSTSADSTVAIRSLRSIIQKLGLLDEMNLKTRDLDLIFASYGTQRVSVFEIAHCILLCGRRRFFPLNYNSTKQILAPLLELMSDRMDDLMIKLHTEKEELDTAISSPLLPGRLVTDSTALEVKKLFETERKSLMCIYQGYSVSYRALTTKWECSSKEGLSDAANYLRSPVRRKLHSLSLNVPVTPCSSGTCCTANGLCGSCESANEFGWSFPTLLQFCRDFMICPDLVSRPQLAKLFNIVLADTTSASSAACGDGYLAPPCGAVDRTPQMLSFNQFLNLLVQIALRTPIFKSSQSTVKRVVSLLLLLNQSTGKPKVLERLNVTSLFFCKGQPSGRQGLLTKKSNAMMM